MNIVIFDTETISIEKPFVYNIGYVIVDTDTFSIIHKADWIVEQIWHNRELFSSAYFADKKEIYISAMRGKKTRMEKLGYITQTMCRLFKELDVQYAFAFNSGFDDGVFKFNCDWFKVKNPFDNIPIYDIMGFAYKFIGFTPAYQKFCEDNQLITPKGHYSLSAESVYKFVSQDTEFIEAHTALADSEIEADILKYCVEKCGADLAGNYTPKYKYIPRKVDKVLKVKGTDGEVTCFPYCSMVQYKEKNKETKIILKGRE
jgi:hypothetical protein